MQGPIGPSSKFKAEFAIQTDDKLILDGLAHMAMKKSEKVRDYFGPLNKTNNIIMKGKCQYTLLPPKPVVQANGFLDTAEVDAYYNIRDKAIGEFNLLNLFRAGLPMELKRVIKLQSLNELDLYNAVKLATIESLSREEAKTSSHVFAIEDDTEDAVDAVNYRPQKSSNQSARGQNKNFRGNNRGASSNRGNPYSWRNPNQQPSGNNSNRNKQVCVFCKIPNHRQEECRKRINANKPCLTPMVALSGQRSTLLLTPTQVRTPYQSSPLRIFDSELDGTPTSSSIRHSANNYEFVYHLNFNL